MSGSASASASASMSGSASSSGSAENSGSMKKEVAKPSFANSAGSGRRILTKVPVSS